MWHEIKEFHCIMPIENIPSVLIYGILSRRGIKKFGIKHKDVSMGEVQVRRSLKVIPNGYALHEYANIYFHARNPMMFKRKDEAENICVLGISIEVLKLPGVVITDQNAASDYVRFMTPNELNSLDFGKIYAKSWKHPNDPIAEIQHKSAKCAEVLVPNVIGCEYIEKAYVVNTQTEKKLIQYKFPSNKIFINPDLFFS